MIGVAFSMNEARSQQLPCESNTEFADLLARVATQQDKSAFAALFEHFGPRIKGFMMRKGVDDELAEDLAQDTMITVWRKAHLYSRERGTVSTWIFTIARNRRIDWARRIAGVQFSDLSDFEPVSDDPEPDAQHHQRQTAELVNTAIEELPEDQKQVISMAFLDDMTQAEIASNLAVPLGTVKSRMRLAYRKLSKSLCILA